MVEYLLITYIISVGDIVEIVRYFPSRNSFVEDNFRGICTKYKERGGETFESTCGESKKFATGDITFKLILKQFTEVYQVD